jgi:hypothetical protein
LDFVSGGINGSIHLAEEQAGHPPEVWPAKARSSDESDIQFL